MIRHLYAHVPFCSRICPYCSFYKTPAAQGGFEGFITALLREASSRAASARPETVFVGGGTPTVLNVRQMERLLGGLCDRMDFSAVHEFTVEMNPATVSPAKAKTLRSLGVNRASLGVQSWDEAHLKTLGRAHSPEAAHKSVQILRDAGFENLNLDLMFGIPGQSLEDWQRSLEVTVDLQPTHVSAYSLTYEEDTEFFERLGRGEFFPDGTLDADQFELAISTLEAAGFHHYETSNYARPGFECAHNLACWQGEDFLGLGPSAVSTLGNVRVKNIPDTPAYVARCEADISPADFSETLQPSQQRLERLALGLRTSLGVPESFADTVARDRLVLEGLIELRGSSLTLTPRGRLVADEVALALAE